MTAQPFIDAITAARIVSDQRDAFLASPGLDPAWIAGWHSAIQHATCVLAAYPG